MYMDEIVVYMQKFDELCFHKMYFSNTYCRHISRAHYSDQWIKCNKYFSTTF